MDSTELFCKRRLYAEVQIQCDMKEYVAACYFKCDKDNYVQCLNDPAIVDTQYRLHRNHLFDCKLDEQDKKKLRDYTTDDGNHINIDTYVRGHVIGPMEGDWDNINDCQSLVNKYLEDKPFNADDEIGFVYRTESEDGRNSHIAIGLYKVCRF
eukprot:429355_1